MVKYELSDYWKELINKISETTLTNYDIKGNDIEIDALLNVIEDLYMEYDHLQEEFEDFKKDVEDNYKHIEYKDQVEGYEEF